MRLKISMLLVLISNLVAGQEPGFINNDWLLATIASQEKKRPIFVFATIKGCGPCIQMEREVFSYREVKKLLEERFVCLKIDGQAGQGRVFVKDNYVLSYPTLLFFDSAQQLIHRNRSVSTKSFLLACKLALNPKTRLPALTKQFQTQKVDTTFLKNYIKILSAAERNTGPAIDSLFKVIKFEFTHKNIHYLHYLNSCHSEFLDFVISNRKKYFPPVDSAPLIESAFSSTQDRLFVFGDFSESEYLALKEKIIKAKIIGWEDRISSLEKLYSKIQSKD
jgi:thioredoxin-related protein